MASQLKGTTPCGINDVLRFMAKWRDVLQGMALTSESNQDWEVYQFVFATQSPMRVHYLPCQLTHANLPDVKGLPFQERQAKLREFAPWAFSFDVGKYDTDKALKWSDLDKLWAWPYFSLTVSHRAIATTQPMPLTTLMERLRANGIGDF